MTFKMTTDNTSTCISTESHLRLFTIEAIIAEHF